MPYSYEPIETPIEVLKGVWWIAAVSLGVALIATPVARLIAHRARIVDRPDDLLKPHGRPVAYLGGAAICIGLLAGMACYLAVMPGGREHLAALGRSIAERDLAALMNNPAWNLFAIAAGSVVITVVGLLDDVYDITPKRKVLGQVLAAAFLVVGGVGDRMAQMFFNLLHLPAPAPVVVVASAGMCIVIVIATCNATNLLDGLDGLCGGVTGIIALGFLALAVWLATYERFPDSEVLRVGLMLAMAGAVFGFLPYNVPPATIFMGDAGSMLLGFFVATSMAMFCQESNPRWFLAAWAVFALPTLDTALAVVRRLLSGKSIFAGDRSHLYDQLVDRGMSVKQVVVLFYALAAGAAVLGVTVAVCVRLRYAAVLYLALLVGAFALFHWLGMIRPEGRSGDAGQGDEP
jgi:UDP-GlcNAc:undecaprenyl-phosphate GlcNAc-1-phosphate transferase